MTLHFKTIDAAGHGRGEVHSLLAVDQVLAWEGPVMMAIASSPAYLGFQSQWRVRAIQHSVYGMIFHVKFMCDEILFIRCKQVASLVRCIDG